jgi:two-component system, NtrC family, sensor kinase
MARPSGTGGKASLAKARKTRSVKGRNPGKTKRSIAQTATRPKRSSPSDLGKELKEAREQQAATAEILKVIAASPGDGQPVLDAVAVQTNRLVGGFTTVVWRILEDVAHLAAYTQADPAADEALKAAAFRRPLSSWQIGETIRKGQVFSVADTERDVRSLRDLARVRGFRSILYVPMMHNHEPIGVIGVTRSRPGKFADHHVNLLKTFADQAVIAIENVRLFNETKEALERQTATADILKVIASSPSDTTPVFDAIASSANRLLGGFSTAVFRFAGETVHLSAFTPVNPDADAILQSHFPRPVAGFEAARLAQQGKPVQISDTENAEDARIREAARSRGFRSMLFAPLMNNSVPIGVISVTRAMPGSFATHHVQLLQTFADQAVIAIENARLFDEVQARTNELAEALTYQTGSANILNVIASSPTEVQPVLQAIVESACELCGAYDAVLRLKQGDRLERGAHYGPVPPNWNLSRVTPHWTAGRAVIEGRAVHVHDMSSCEGDEFPEAQARAREQGHRTILSVPLLQEGASIGAITLRRLEVNPFTEKQIALLQTFADQAVIAIGNVHLFEQVQDRTRQLSRSLEDLRTAQDRLVQTQKLASLGQLTAGIAHEIKNPLNFVNNFSGMSTELIGELRDIVTGLSIDPDTHADIKELTDMLHANLEKIVEHGKRADAIVKSMLLHSGQSSGEHRLSDINALVDESLNRAYYGERAETRGFTIKLEKSLDPAVGEVDLFPREISRALLNLISNGFYATIKRKETEGSEYEPVLFATTRNLGDRVEIRIRDNGAGIPAGVREKMFDPFFTTKPPGEGTGLGLSITHDIIVKQHGGSIEVDTKLGEFAEVRLILPRSGALLSERQ